MAIYNVVCTACEAPDEQHHQMPRNGGAPPFEPCIACGAAVKRVFSVPADHSANTFRPRWSDQLSTGLDPVYIKTKDQYEHLKKQCGVTEWEKGMTQDKQREKKHQKDQMLESTFRRAMGE
jgi:hypothetical protein